MDASRRRFLTLVPILFVGGCATDFLGGESDKPVGRNEVTEVQRLLTLLGYETGPQDGVVGPRTSFAIRRYQQEKGLRMTGEPSAALLVRLKSDLGPTANNVGSAQSGGWVNPNR